MAITALPALDRTGATFRADVDTFFDSQLPTFSVEVEAARVEINAAGVTAQAAIDAGLANAATNATTATTQAGIAATKANDANDSAIAAAASADAAAASVASIAGGPVASVNGMTGVVTGLQAALVSGANIKTVNGTSLLGSGNVATGDVTLAGAETLTNKTLSGATNDVEARSIKSATTTVSVSGAAAPTAGQVLKATGPTAAAWQTHSEFATGTAMLFAQTAAPTGWTKSTTHDNKALRVVSGTAGSGGSTAFTTVFASRTPAGSVTVGGTTLTESQMPAHTHTTSAYNSHGTGSFDSAGGSSAVNYVSGASITSSSTGGGGSHTHTGSFTGTAMDFAVQYVDVIIATKD